MAARIRLQLALDHYLSPSSRFGAYLRPSSPHLILRTQALGGALGVVGEGFLRHPACCRRAGSQPPTQARGPKDGASIYHLLLIQLKCTE
ncbi:unnamed protein product [Musa banksii]